MDELTIGYWGWFWLVVFLAGTLGIGLYALTKTKTGEDFAVARKSYGPYLLILALTSTVASGSTFRVFPDWRTTKGFRLCGTRRSIQLEFISG